ncbi:LCP family protein [Aeromicrobium sp. CF4.19]|uniref:LCP family protein n=1 Tax=Aeromicrobium sp. CF4.19 TaxID=3373082 RepID=UPI003EE60DD0
MASHRDDTATTSDDADSDNAGPRRGFIRRHRALSAVVGLFATLLLIAGGFAIWLNSSLGDIERVPVTLEDADRPAPSEDGDAINILLLGTDAGSERNTDGRSILQDAASGDWPSGKYRSDATLLVHIPGDRESAVVMSIPRDSYVEVNDERGESTGRNKINSALSLYGPSGAISTVENLTDLRLDHVAMVDWDGFRSITDSLGGITMTTDEGTSEYDGEQALDYVRERYDVEGGDFGRIQRQQNFLRAVMVQTLSRDTLTNPLRLRSTVSSVAQNLAVDDDWSNGDIRSLAVAMRGVRPGDVTFMTVPTQGTDTVPDAGSIVRLDPDGLTSLFEAVSEGGLVEYLDANPDLTLPPSDEVD